MKRIALVTSIALLCLGLAGGSPAQERPAPATTVAPSETGEQVVTLKDGGRLVLRKNGTVYHADAAGNRMRMKDGVIMEAVDGTRYMMRNDAVWRTITEKGTLSGK